MSMGRKRRFIEINRNQYLLRPTDVDKLIEESHAARAIWEFVLRLDLSDFYKEVTVSEGEVGRSAWDPRLLIAVWIYAYSRGIGSAREIERRCEHDPAFQWLTGMEVINHHTLSDFRMTDRKRLDELFKQVLGLLSSDGLIGMERVMLDGTKIRAKASRDTFRREDRIREYLRLAEEQIQAMGNPQEDNFSKREEKANQRVCLEKKEKLELALKELEKIRASKDAKAKEEARVSLSDPEARIMRLPEGGFAPSYNGQISTDSKHGMVVGLGVTQSGTDSTEFLPALETMEKNLDHLPTQVVVDGGYASNQNIIAAADKQLDLIAPIVDREIQRAPANAALGISSEFSIDKFTYCPEQNCYFCPTGKRLTYQGRSRSTGREGLNYRATKKDCENCRFKTLCCPKNVAGRTLKRIIEDQKITAFKKKMRTEEAIKIYKQRGPVAEFSNAWLKTKIGLRQFCVVGLEKAHMELTWACLALNLAHWTRVKWALAR